MDTTRNSTATTSKRPHMTPTTLVMIMRLMRLIQGTTKHMMIPIRGVMKHSMSLMLKADMRTDMAQ